MTHSNSNLQHRIVELDHVNLVAYMRLVGYKPTFSNDDITVFALPDNASRKTIVTINNHFNRIEAVRMTSDGNVLDLASLVFQVSREQVLADPAAYGIKGTLLQDINNEPPGPQ